MRVATWCVGGLDSRLEYICHWLARRKPDLVAFQKTFVATGNAPVEALRRAGYESVFYSRDGEYRNGWGVAVLCRMPRAKPTIVQEGLPGQSDRSARFLTVRSGDLEFSSVYAPYGNPRKNGFDGALERKIEWMNHLVDHLGMHRERAEQRVLAGDFNVVTEGKARPRTLNHTRAERDALARVMELGFVDLHRHRHPEGDNGYNYGFDTNKPVTSRLHRILGTDAVARRVREAWVDLEYRQPIEGLTSSRWPQGAPVIVDLG